MKRLSVIVCGLIFMSRLYSVDDGLEKVTFMPQWTAQAQFSGYYMALEKGFYKKRGLDVLIEHATPISGASDALKTGKADIVTLFLSTGIKNAAAGMDIVEIAQISQKSALVLVTLKKSGIGSPAAMKNKKFGIWQCDFQEIPMAFMKKYDINPHVIPIATGINLFLWGGVDILTVMWYNEYHTLIMHGVETSEINTFFLSEHGLDIPEDGIFCSGKFLKDKPDVCKKFVEASIEGWEYAAKHKEETVKIVEKTMKIYNLPFNKAHQSWMLDRMADLIFPGGKKLDSVLSEAVYNKTALILKESGSIKEAPEYKNFFKAIGDAKK
ncbi:MAG: hypothetical protein A2020_14580 [Lentisphaerae bacterium GWF2_45_14]|nr:MAG: hypothetical protein A2020_14580 [Lentisphaerae bacterium GWF2_45_14]